METISLKTDAAGKSRGFAYVTFGTAEDAADDATSVSATMTASARMVRAEVTTTTTTTTTTSRRPVRETTDLT